MLVQITERFLIEIFYHYGPVLWRPVFLTIKRWNAVFIGGNIRGSKLYSELEDQQVAPPT